MTDEEPTGSCVCCRKRDPRQGYACDADRSKFRGWLAEIPDLWSQLLDDADALVIDMRPVIEKRLIEEKEVEVVTNRPRDPVAHHLPTGASASQSRGGPISGSREPQLPIVVDRFDLVHGAGAYLPEGEDQVGYLPVWLTLATWARDWATYRGMGEVGSGSSVADLCSWMWERVDAMADEHPAIDEAFRDIRSLRGAMLAQLGQVDVPDYKKGVPCRNPECNALALVHHAGSEWVECGECSSLLSFDDYDRWTRLVAAAAKKMEKAA